jgi:hypothetical protein
LTESDPKPTSHTSAHCDAALTFFLLAYDIWGSEQGSRDAARAYTRPGHAEGKNATVEYCWARDQSDQLLPLAAVT